MEKVRVFLKEYWWVILGVVTGGFFLGGAVRNDGFFGEVTAAWVQAIGAIAAIAGGFETARRQLKHAAELRAANAAESERVRTTEAAETERVRLAELAEAERVRLAERRHAESTIIEAANQVGFIAFHRMRIVTTEFENGNFSTPTSVRLADVAVLADLETVKSFNSTTIPDIQIFVAFLALPGILTAYRAALLEFIDIEKLNTSDSAKAQIFIALKKSLRDLTNSAELRQAELLTHVDRWRKGT